jgi:hypothetical protein
MGAGQPVLYGACQIWLGSLEQGMDLVWHPAVGQNNPPASQCFLLQTQPPSGKQTHGDAPICPKKAAVSIGERSHDAPNRPK